MDIPYSNGSKNQKSQKYRNKIEKGYYYYFRTTENWSSEK